MPNWREDNDHNVKCVPIKTSPEEDLQEEPTDDASYLKRHSKYEKKEKQIKRQVSVTTFDHCFLFVSPRWDDQRLRRELQVQKLREKQEKKSLKQSKSESNRLCTSLLPDPFEGKSISFWVRYGLEGNRSPQSAEAVTKRRAEMRTWLKGKFKGRRLLKNPRDHYK